MLSDKTNNLLFGIAVKLKEEQGLRKPKTNNVDDAQWIYFLTYSEEALLSVKKKSIAAFCKDWEHSMPKKFDF